MCQGRWNHSRRTSGLNSQIFMLNPTKGLMVFQPQKAQWLENAHSKSKNTWKYPKTRLFWFTFLCQRRDFISPGLGLVIKENSSTMYEMQVCFFDTSNPGFYWFCTPPPRAMTTWNSLQQKLCFRSLFSREWEEPAPPFSLISCL